ncbi:acyl-ACP--UDP-N-acetylglucosamine O-acyltransferase [bacterium]|nr:acyl-ACP--UDP-N-acetylglucosamine O-acyltransferase [bacterium]MBU1652931.1 acyl-ACP--UDP-N-acetylglucosamine O-acyltransferase [bacterium]
MIHPTAIIDPKAELADDVEVGPFTIIEHDVQVDSGTVIGPSVLLAHGARIGKNAVIHKGAVIGTVPQDLKFGGEVTLAYVGDCTTVREYVTINRGTTDHGKTTVGSDCLLMTYSHIAHDCVVGDKVILANSVNLAGHVHIEENAIIGGIVPLHQFVRVGRHSFIAGGTRVSKDVPPYILAANDPLRYAGLNSVGLRRRGFSAETIGAIKHAYKLIYLSDLNVSQGVGRVKDEMEILPEIQHIIDFIEGSERGII